MKSKTKTALPWTMPSTWASFFSDIVLAKRFAQEAKGNATYLDRGVWSRCVDGVWGEDKDALHISYDIGEFLLRQMALVDQMIPISEDEKEEYKRARIRNSEKNKLGAARKVVSVLALVRLQPEMTEATA